MDITLFLAHTASRCRRAYMFYRRYSFFFRRVITEVTERISTELGQTFTYDYYLKNLVETPPGIYPTGWGQKHYLGQTLNFDLTYLCNATWHQQSEKNSSIYRDSRIHAPKIWWTLFQKRLRRVGEILPTPWMFALGDTASLTAWTLYNRQQPNFGTCYVT